MAFQSFVDTNHFQIENMFLYNVFLLTSPHGYKQKILIFITVYAECYIFYCAVLEYLLEVIIVNNDCWVSIESGNNYIRGLHK